MVRFQPDKSVTGKWRLQGDTAVEVPLDCKRYDLSADVLNAGLLGLDKSDARPFDFLMPNGNLLRGSLAAYVADTGASTEEVLVIRYLFVAGKPRPDESAETDDWVAALDVFPAAAAGQLPIVASAGYDRAVRIWDADLQPVATLLGHEDAVRAVRWAPSRAALVSASNDHTLRLWRLSGIDADGSLGRKVAGECVAVYRGHTDTVQAVAVSPDRPMVASGSWDKTIKIWRIPAASEDAQGAQGDAREGDDAPEAAASSKRRRKGDARADSGKQARVLTAQGTMTAHAQNVSSLHWAGTNALYSGSWDHTVRVWDVDSGANLSTFNSGKTVLAVDFSQTHSLVASAHGDGKIRLFDVRVRDGKQVRAALDSHSGFATGVAWSPAADSHQLASVAHDGKLKVWDMRASVPLHTVAAHGKPALAVAYHSADALVTGGQDNRLARFVRKQPTGSE